MPPFLFGLFVIAVGFVVMGFANVATPAVIFLGIFLFAVGEMIVLAPDPGVHHLDRAQGEGRALHGDELSGGHDRGALSGVTYTALSGTSLTWASQNMSGMPWRLTCLWP